MSKLNSASRQGIVPGEILTLDEFCKRAGIGREGWASLLRRATVAGCSISFVSGRRVYVDTQAWFDFLKVDRNAVTNGPDARSGALKGKVRGNSRSGSGVGAGDVSEV